MATKSEDIRLQINNVRYKKGDGTLYLMAERLGWMPENKDNFTISHKYSDIKTQKISPEGKAKIQLQLVLHTGDATTFQFANLEDRTAVKEALLQILPQFKGKMPKDRERKAILLSKNPHLLQLYKDFVESKLITAEDFWNQFGDETVDNNETDGNNQKVGISANFMNGIPLNGKQVKGTVSVETLYAILRTYPRVAEKHREYVPTKMSETEFWNKFFQSRYFNRDRTKDVHFGDAVKTDEREWTSSVQKGHVDVFNDFELYDNKCDYNRDDDPAPSSSHSNQESLLSRKFTQTSIRIVGSLEPSASDAPSQNSSQSSNRDAETSKARHAGANRDFTFHDLAGKNDDGDYLDDSNKIGSKVSQVDRELYTVIPNDQRQSQLNSATIRDYMDAIKNWEPHLTECLATNDANEALKHLSPAGNLMRSSNTNRLADTVPEEVQTKLKSAYYASNELLRHFWLCFPAVEPGLEDKLTKLSETIKIFESNKLQPFHDSLSRDQRHLLNHLLRVQFKAANRKYDNWKNKKRQRDPAKSRGVK